MPYDIVGDEHIREDAMGDATILLRGATVYPVVSRPVPRGALALRGAHVLAVGPAEALAATAGPHTRVIDLPPDWSVVPGFVDSHQHLLAYVRARSRLALWHTDTIGAVVQAIRQAAAHGTGWLVAVGHDQGRLAEQRHPTLAELDAAVPHRPLVIYRACMHLALVNSRALQQLGITADTADPAGGRIVRHAGQPTGVLEESALGLLAAALPAEAIDWAGGLRLAAAEYHRRGITAIGEAALGHIAGAADLARMVQALEQGLALRVYALLSGAVADAALAGQLPRHHADGRLHLGAIKIFADGTLGAGTAWLSADYGDAPGQRGGPTIEPVRLLEQVAEAHRAGWQVAIHAIGDETVALAIAAYEAALRAQPRHDHRHRIEHVEVLRAGLAERMAAAGIVAAVQSPFTYWEAGDVSRLGTAQRAWAHPWAALERAGVIVSDGSDNPVLPDFHPLQGLYAATTRRNHAGMSIAPEQTISVASALRRYTLGGALVAFAEARYGALRHGMFADVAVIDCPLDEAHRDHLASAAVRATFSGGVLVHDALP
jgi:predicted amidohydrolase YtcJ